MDQPDLTNAQWRKSRRSGEQGSCVELARVSQVIAVRDSKNPGGPALAFSRAAWRAFANTLKDHAR
ncbi:MAG TPA: DUF397 domain-containing protein [Streptosporangiaceae bacterium]|jgi:hypothetical protein